MQLYDVHWVLTSYCTFQYKFWFVNSMPSNNLSVSQWLPSKNFIYIVHKSVVLVPLPVEGCHSFILCQDVSIGQVSYLSSWILNYGSHKLHPSPSEPNMRWMVLWVPLLDFELCCLIRKIYSDSLFYWESLKWTLYMILCANKIVSWVFLLTCLRYSKGWLTLKTFYQNYYSSHWQHTSQHSYVSQGKALADIFVCFESEVQI